MLTKTDLDTALSYYPHIAEQIKKVARDRANLVNKLNEIVAKAAAEGKSAADTAKAVAQGTKDEDEEKDSKKEKENEEPATAAAATSAPAPGSNAPAAKPAPAQSVWKTKVWPPVKKLLTFTIKKEGVLGTVLHLLGCLMAYLSAFTISYQVCMISQCLTCQCYGSDFLGLFPK